MRFKRAADGLVVSKPSERLMGGTMKRYFSFLLLLGVVFITGCQSKSIGIIGGTDGPTSIVVSDSKMQKSEKKPIKLIRINGSLYYESGAESETEAGCGVMDGQLRQSVGSYEIPQQDGENNFSEANAYQYGTQENTLEVLFENRRSVFSKIDTDADVLQYRYCYVLEGRFPNAEADSRVLVLANEENISFDDVFLVIFGSGTRNTKNIYTLPLSD